jgi:hypothetical protein
MFKGAGIKRLRVVVGEVWQIKMGRIHPEKSFI